MGSRGWGERDVIADREFVLITSTCSPHELAQGHGQAPAPAQFEAGAQLPTVQPSAEPLGSSRVAHLTVFLANGNVLVIQGGSLLGQATDLVL